ncbi:pyridoxamine 5'-phosphate oxidase family protein [Halorientalis salina]|uniref:pyridoxamine 5'-phosphate oxidase family protein n=1 Tax=Halorientalis salina TaxID=2932266 RepID=UPI0010ABEB7D|nr:pyridoxamine 5'-phosphate oxidase family protein [Halorientalis salina]
MSVDELADIGLERMTDSEIQSFLSNQGMGVLGLPTEGAPYLLPLSFGYDGGSQLYFTYVLGESSRKEELSDLAETARFLVYKADTMFSWESVLLTGTIEGLPESTWDEAIAAFENAWSPDIFREADLTRKIKIYEFHIDDQVGIKHMGLPEGFRT